MNRYVVYKHGFSILLHELLVPPNLEYLVTSSVLIFYILLQIHFISLSNLSSLKANVSDSIMYCRWKWKQSMINAVAVMVDLLCEMRSFEWVLWLRQEVECWGSGPLIWPDSVRNTPKGAKESWTFWKGDYLRPLPSRETWLPYDKIWISQYFVHMIELYNRKGELWNWKKALSFLFNFLCSCIITSFALLILMLSLMQKSDSDMSLSCLSRNLRCDPHFSAPNFTTGLWISHSQGALYIHHSSESPFRNSFPGSARENRSEIRTACDEHSPQVILQTCSLADLLLVAINSQH